MKPVFKPIDFVAAGILAGLCLSLTAGCASTPPPNRKVYDRYAELVAARTRAAQAPADKAGAATAEKPAAAKPASKPAATPAKPAPVAKTEPEAKPAPVAKAEPEAKPVPVPAPPVEVIAPAPVEPAVPAPVVPEPVVSAPVPPPPVQMAVPPPAVDVPPAQPVPEPPPVAVTPPAPAPVSAPVEPPPAGSMAVADGSAYFLKVGDVIQIFLRGIPTSDAIEDVIDENGNVSLPLINEVRAAGMTAAELERNIRKIYIDLDIYRNIAVTVVVPTRYYFIQGEIRGPGRFQIVSATRVSQAIAAAGGYTEYASGQVVVKRGGKIVKTIRNAKRLERTPQDDILLEPDDIIEVRRSLW